MPTKTSFWGKQRIGHWAVKLIRILEILIFGENLNFWMVCENIKKIYINNKFDMRCLWQYYSHPDSSVISSTWCHVISLMWFGLRSRDHNSRTTGEQKTAVLIRELMLNHPDDAHQRALRDHDAPKTTPKSPLKLTPNKTSKSRDTHSNWGFMGILIF